MSRVYRRVRKAPVPKSHAEQYAEAVVKCTRANHYLVTVRCPDSVTYDDIIRIVQEWYAREAVGRMSHALVTRCLICVNESTDYSLTDIGA